LSRPRYEILTGNCMIILILMCSIVPKEQKCSQPCCYICCSDRNRETSFAVSIFTKSDFTCSTIPSRTATRNRSTIPPHFCRRCERPSCFSIGRDNFCNLISELFVNAPVRFCCQLCTLGDRSRTMMRTSAIGHWEPARQVAQLVDQSSVGVGDIERLNELQA